MYKERIPFKLASDAEEERKYTDLLDTAMDKLRSKNWLETDTIIKTGVDKGKVLEIMPGPGYLGYEWLEKTKKSKLTFIDDNDIMLNKAKENSKKYNLQNRISFHIGNVMNMEFEDESFDGVFTYRDLHQWEDPVKVLNEIYRVLKPGGRYYISDLKRDIHPALRTLTLIMSRPRLIKKRFKQSILASYSSDEIIELIKNSSLKETASIAYNSLGFIITGVKK